MKTAWIMILCFSIKAIGQTNDLIHFEKPQPGVTITLRCLPSNPKPEEPLLLINGRPRPFGEFSNLTPGKVISVEVLKDSQAIAIYGSRAQYGAVLVKTTDTIPTKHILPVYTPNAIDSIFKGRAFWAYSIARVGTAHDSLYYYSIELNIVSHDSTGHPKPFSKLRGPGARIFCRFRENGIQRRIPFIWNGSDWFADFAIHTDQLIKIEIVTSYKNEKKTMHTSLNSGIYPGEDTYLRP